MSAITQGKRVEWPEGLLSNGEYAKHLQDGNWYAMTPTGLLAGLAKHNVVEHEDGTITVSPSILVHGRDGDRIDVIGHDASWHGYLERGVWREC